MNAPPPLSAQQFAIVCAYMGYDHDTAATQLAEEYELPPATARDLIAVAVRERQEIELTDEADEIEETTTGLTYVFVVIGPSGLIWRWSASAAQEECDALGGDYVRKVGGIPAGFDPSQVTELLTAWPELWKAGER